MSICRSVIISYKKHFSAPTVCFFLKQLPFWAVLQHRSTVKWKFLGLEGYEKKKRNSKWTSKVTYNSLRSPCRKSIKATFLWITFPCVGLQFIKKLIFRWLWFLRMNPVNGIHVPQNTTNLENITMIYELKYSRRNYTENWLTDWQILNQPGSSNCHKRANKQSCKRE